MSIPPVPNHPPRPGRRKPAEESPESITTQLFIGQEKSADADGSTQALSVEDLERLRASLAADGTEATEVLSLDELREIAASAESEPQAGADDGGASQIPRKAKSSDIAEAGVAAAPKQWNPQQFGAAQHGSAAPQSGWAQQSRAGTSGPSPVGHRTGQTGPGQSAGWPGGSGGYAAATGYGQASGGPGHPVPPGNGGGPGYPGGTSYPGGPGNGGWHGGPGGPQGPREETKKVPAWLWVVSSLALVATIAIVGYIAWDSLQNREQTTAGQVTTPAPASTGPAEEEPEESAPPAPSETFASPSNNITCTIDSDRARCQIASYDYQPPEKPADCQLAEWGSVVVANDEGSGFSCRENPASTGKPKVLDYGESVSAEGMTCTSTEEGMTCTSDSTGIGFTIRRASVDFLE